MIFKGSKIFWNLSGAVLTLSAALSSSSCCSHRKVAESSRTETAEHVTTDTQRCEAHTRHQEATLTRETGNRGLTVTEIEVYDTEQPPDPETGKGPLKARIRQTHGDEARSNETATITTESNANVKTKAEQTFDGGTLEELTVTSTKAPSLWERLKQGAQWALAIIIPVAAGWIVITSNKSTKHG